MIEDEWNDTTTEPVTPKSSLDKKIHQLIAEDTAQRSRTETYYRKIKEENLDKYLSPKIQKQMEADAQALQEKFFDGD